MEVIQMNKTDTTYRNEALDRWISSIRSYKVLSVREEEEVIQKYKDGNKRYLDIIVKGNQRFLLAAARTYSRNADEILELISEGNIGLLQAIEKYNLTYGVRFLSFAAHYIKRQMLAYFTKNSLIRQRTNKTIEAFVKKTKDNWLQDNGFEIPDWILAEVVSDNFDREFRDNGAYYKKASVYFDEDLRVEDDEGNTTIEKTTSVENEAIENLEHQDYEKLSLDLIENTCQNEIEKSVIIYSYGLFGKDKLTEYEIANKYKLEIWQVSYIRKKIEERMRLYSKGKKIRLNKSKFQKNDK